MAGGVARYGLRDGSSHCFLSAGPHNFRYAALAAGSVHPSGILVAFSSWHFRHENAWTTTPCTLSPQPCLNAYGNCVASTIVQSCRVCDNPCLCSCENRMPIRMQTPSASDADQPHGGFVLLLLAGITVAQEHGVHGQPVRDESMDSSQTQPMAPAGPRNARLERRKRTPPPFGVSCPLWDRRLNLSRAM